MEEERGPAKKEERIVCCIGDIHGYISKLQNLWSNLESAIDPPSFQTALIIFLGDYCDRGPDTRKVFDFLISLPSKYPNQTHVFLCGNHDFAFAAFVKVLPLPPDGSAFSETWKEYDQHEEKEGWFKGIGFEDMHLQGRRWSGVIKERFNKAKGMDYMGSIYDAGPTFESYGVPHGSAELVTAVPDEHKKFLADLVWVHEEDDVCIEIGREKKHCKLVAVHAGLEKAKGVEEQLKLLKARDTREPKVQCLSGRKNVLEIPKELCEKPTIVVSGHHGKLFIEGLRLVIDEGGGLEKNAIAAIILPSMKIVRDTDAKSGKICAGKSSSYEPDSSSSSMTVSASEKVLVPGIKSRSDNDSSSSSIGSQETPEADSAQLQIFEKVVKLTMEDEEKVSNEEDIVSSQVPSEDGVVESKEATISSQAKDGILESKKRSIPPPGTGQKIYEQDPFLKGHREHLDYRYAQYKKMREMIDKYEGGLEAFSRGYEKLGFNRSDTGITYREWAPAAKSAALIGDFNNWNPNADVMTQNEFGVWELFLPNNADGSPSIPHGSRVKIRMDTTSGIKDSIPAWIKFSVQAPGEIPYNGIYYDPPKEEKYVFVHPQPKKPRSLRIYEAHVGMSSTEPKINTYASFRDDVLPRIKKLGYNAVQLMAIQEHSYYASFGYHVTNFFAPSSRCGTPDDLKSLVDKAHELGLLVLMDIVHSHASNNVLDGLNMFDGTDSQYFHSGSRGYHWMWDSRLFNYGNWEVLRYLLSNARWWLDEYKFDGFRFDGVTSMMYTHHGLQVAFTGNYNEYFGLATDVDAVVYLMLVNDLIHGLFPEAVTVGEDVSGMPTFGIPVQDGGVGFDYRLHMAVADKWIEILKKRDEDWQMGDITHTLTNRRWLERCVVYAESHDQALVGDKTIAFQLMDKDMYDFMALDRPSTPVVDRGIALHKMIRLITMGLGGEGYLNFMGNEFGHPEWIDFPRGDQKLPNGRLVPGNNNSFDKCRRRFDLADADYLRYHGLQEFDRAMQLLEETYGFMTSEHQYISRKDEGDRVITFERGNLIFVFNFHWSSSYSDYRIGCLKPGKYRVVMDSDDKQYGGFDRIDHKVDYFSSEGWFDNRPNSFLVYAPCRTAVVYALIED